MRLLSLEILGTILFSFSPASAQVLRPKVVIIAMFEPGQDTGDTPGELQLWVEREKLDRVLPLPSAFHDVRANADGSILATVTGVGNTRAAASIMALGSDPRFDFSRSYWLIAGIAGIDPADGSLGSAAWAEWIVNGDISHALDSREAPRDWPIATVPLGKRKPYELPRSPDDLTPVFHLNAGLVGWAFELTKDVKLPDTPGMARRRADFVAQPNAQHPPAVLRGDTLASERYWHGARMNRWANEWVKYHTNGRGSYVTSAMEDAGTLQSLVWLSRSGRVDARRVLVLRTAASYDGPPPGQTAAESLFGEKLEELSAYLPSLEAAYRVGSKVVHELIGNWPRYKTEVPSRSF